MDYYIDKIKESIEFAWKFKFLWFFGFLIALFGSSQGGGFNFNSPTSNSGDSTNVDMNGFSDDVSDLLANTTFWIIFSISIAVVLVLALIGWYLLSVSKGALVQAVKKEAEGKELSLGEGWRDGSSTALDIMILDVIGFLINLGILSPFIIVVFIGILFPPMLLLCCCIAPFYFFYLLFVWSQIYSISYRLVVLKGYGPLESLGGAYKLYKDRILNIIILMLINFATWVMWTIISLIIIAIPGIVLLLLIVGLIIVSPIVGIFLAVIAIIAIVVLAGLLWSPYKVYSSAFWTKIIMDLLDDKAPR